eukprot:scaffold803_cov310-Pinguiococcus_pyrenoidosus.AAC.192
MPFATSALAVLRTPADTAARVASGALHQDWRRGRCRWRHHHQRVAQSAKASDAQEAHSEAVHVVGFQPIDSNATLLCLGADQLQAAALRVLCQRGRETRGERRPHGALYHVADLVALPPVLKLIEADGARSISVELRHRLGNLLGTRIYPQVLQELPKLLLVYVSGLVSIVPPERFFMIHPCEAAPVEGVA